MKSKSLYLALMFLVVGTALAYSNDVNNQIDEAYKYTGTLNVSAPVLGDQTFNSQTVTADVDGSTVCFTIDKITIFWIINIGPIELCTSHNNGTIPAGTTIPNVSVGGLGTFEAEVYQTSYVYDGYAELHLKILGTENGTITVDYTGF